jgi:hypothetical protein
MTARSMFLAPIFATMLSGTVADARAEVGGPAVPALPREASHQRTSVMKIGIKVEDKIITATLLDNETARDFISLLPLTLTLEDYAATEKISFLSRKLSTKGMPMPGGSDPKIGDITYYAPWGNLAIFHKNFEYSNVLFKLGSIDSGVEALARPGPIKVTIDLIKN